MTDSHTPHRNVRVPDDRWDGFGSVVGARNRSSWLNAFIDLVLADPKLWSDVRAIAAAKGVPLIVVVSAALRQYRNRYRHLLDEADDTDDTDDD